MLGTLEKQKIKEDARAKAFSTGTKLCWYIFAMSFIFFWCWYIGHSRESFLISNGTAFSKTFFYLNPNIFNKIFLQGNILSYLSGASSKWSFIFLVCYLLCVVCFIGTISCCGYLLIISYNTAIRPFHYIACLGIFPVIGVFLISWFVIKLAVFQVETKKRGRSRFSQDFEPEIFKDPILEQMTKVEDLAHRPITAEFGKTHYDKFFKENKKDWLMDIYRWLTANLI